MRGLFTLYSGMYYFQFLLWVNILLGEELMVCMHMLYHPIRPNIHLLEYRQRPASLNNYTVGFFFFTTFVVSSPPALQWWDIRDWLCGAQSEAAAGSGGPVRCPRLMGGAVQQWGHGGAGPQDHHWGCASRWEEVKEVNIHLKTTGSVQVLPCWNFLGLGYSFAFFSCSPAGALWDPPQDLSEPRPMDSRDRLGDRCVQAQTQGAENTLPGRHWENVRWEIRNEDRQSILKAKTNTWLWTLPEPSHCSPT